MLLYNKKFGQKRIIMANIIKDLISKITAKKREKKQIKIAAGTCFFEKNQL